MTALTSGSATSKGMIKELKDRITGRYAGRDIIDPETEEVIVAKNELITNDLAEKIQDAGIKRVGSVLHLSFAPRCLRFRC